MLSSSEEKLKAFNEWAAYYFSWSDTPSVEEMTLVLDAWEAGFIYAKRSESQSE